MKFSSVLIVILLLLIIVNISTRLLNSSIDYDEGFNLQVSLNLKQSLRYATFDRVFDPKITTGPTILAPAALFVNSQWPLLPRIIPLIYSLIFLVLVISKILNSRLEKILFLILVFFTPLFFLFSSKVLGELPGFVFLLISYYSFSQKRFLLTGIFGGLSFLTKTVFIIGLLPLFILSLNQLKPFRLKSLMVFLKNTTFIAGGSLLIFIIWNLYIFLSTGIRVDQYIQLLSGYYQEMQQLGTPKPKLLPKRLEMLSYVFLYNPIVFSLLTLGLSIYVFISSKSQMIKLLALYYAISLLYFLFRGSTNLYRHIFSAILSLTIIIPVFIKMYIQIIKLSQRRSKLTYICLPFLLLFFVLNPDSKTQGRFSDLKFYDQSLIFLEHSHLPLFSPTQLLTSQLQTAKFIAENIPPQEKIAGYSWWNAPEIIYLTQRQISRDILNSGNKYIIYQVYGLLSPGLYQKLDKQISKEEIFRNYGYSIFRKI